MPTHPVRSAVLALLTFAAVAGPVQAQGGLPDWLAPQAPPEPASAWSTDHGPFPDASGPGGPTPLPPVPVDGGLSLLALAGAGYAARRLRRR